MNCEFPHQRTYKELHIYLYILPACIHRTNKFRAVQKQKKEGAGVSSRRVAINNNKKTIAGR